MLNGQRVFVLGSGSFSGAHFVRHCLDAGAIVEGTNRSQEDSHLFRPYLTHPLAKTHFRFHRLHLLHDVEAIIKVIRDFSPHYVVDFAGQGMVAPSWQNPALWFETNVVAKIMIHEALRVMPQLKAYLRFSTPEVYGSTQGVVREDAPLNPSTPYATSHAAIDMSLMNFARQHSFPVILTRTTNVYGCGQQLYRIIPKTVLCARKGKTLTLDGGGTSVRNFIEIGDVCRGLIQLLVTPEARGQIFHLGTDEYVSIRELVQRLSQRLQVPFDSFVRVGADRPGKDQAYTIDSSKIRALCDWTPQVNLETGLRMVVEWIDENLAELDNFPWDYIHKD